MSKQTLLSVSADAKTVKGEKRGILTAVLYLAPSDLSGVMNTCPFASAGCRSACLYTAGRSGIPLKNGTFPIQEARIRKTVFFKEDKSAFVKQLIEEITAFIKKAHKKDLTPVVRLNGTSDILWEKLGIMEKFPEVQFYDYTKIPKRALDWATGKMPKNYHLTFSLNEANRIAAEKVAKAGGNVAVVFSKPTFPDTYMGLPVVNGDETDLRFFDPKGSVVGLKAKGKAKRDTSGFVVQV